MLTKTLGQQGRRLLLAASHIKQQNLVKTSNLRCFSTTDTKFKRIGTVLPETHDVPKRESFKESILPLEWQNLVAKYPEFLPDPMNHAMVLVMRQVEDMLKRRTIIDIPEFYVGSVLAVTVTDQYAETKKSRFVGICISRTGQLLWASFTLRNIVDGMGCEIRYDMYNPLIISIEVLKLEKRLDDNLAYLRDCPPEYSFFPQDMKPELLEPGAEVPVNKMLVKLKPQPWSRRWERWLFKGIEKFEDIPEWFAEKVRVVEDNPVYSYDLMLEYRRHCTEEMLYNICKRLDEHEKSVVSVRSEAKSKRFIRFVKSSPKERAERAQTSTSPQPNPSTS